MESLAKFVAFMVLSAVGSGPLAIAITLIPNKNLPLMILRRILHGIFVAVSLFFGLLFFVNPEMPSAIHVIGLYGLVMGYIASRREYFPDFRIIALLLSKLGLRKHRMGKGNIDGQDSEGRSSHSASPFGPLMKWRRNGSSGGNDGHGPGGQH